jgi:oxygen-independent coproporphyrinogen-3 oxidase
MTELEAQGRRPIGVYVHFPWCLKKCPYCDFLSIAAERPAIPHRAYADAVIAEFAARREDVAGFTLNSVFFGGGTPSLWEPSELGRVLETILDAFPLRSERVEITAECNPTSFDVPRARELVENGINRVSIGVQGLEQSRLEFLGRLHDVDGGLQAVQDALSASVPRVSADFIFGVAAQTPDAAATEASRLAALGTTHLSAYALTIEPGTQFGALARKGRLPLLDDGLVADSFNRVDETLCAAGFEHYETSNFARQGHVSEHNLGYWRGLPYLGLGCGAWGTLTRNGRRIRYRNTPSAERYLAASSEWRAHDLWSPNPLLGAFEDIDPETALSERIMLGLRLAEGLDIEAAASECGARAWTPARAAARDKLLAQKRLEATGSRLTIPKASWLFADGIIAELM